MKTPEIRKEFVKCFESLAQRYSRHQIWSDFIIMSACAIANACDKTFFEEREAMYMDCVKHYSRDEVDKIAEMMSLTVLALEEDSEQDFLGEIFGSLNLHNEWRGQFFTPYHIAKLMAKINTGNIVDDVKDRGVVTVSDCCCGAGCLLMAFANAVKEAGVNYQKHILFVAQDVDMIAGLMCYIQLSILGCRGYVKIGDSLLNPVTTNEAPSKDIWFTPMYKLRNIITFMEIFDAAKNENIKDTVPA